MIQREFVNVPQSYYRTCEQSGQIVQLSYHSQGWDKEALVYLPYGYKTSGRAYSAFYMMHGGGGNCEELFGGPEAATDLKNILDHMIQNGDIAPVIVVTPSFYHAGTEEARTSADAAAVLTRSFSRELVRDLIPAVEKQFRVIATRECRCFGGYSMGAEATWNVLASCLDAFMYFLPMSGDCWAVEVQGGATHPKETADYLSDAVRAQSGRPFRVFACVGDAGVAYRPMDTMLQEMARRTDIFQFDQDFSGGNTIYCVAPGGTHSYEYCYQYLYNALPLIFPADLLTVYVRVGTAVDVRGRHRSVTHLTFEGEAKSHYFIGKICAGAVDWQETDASGVTRLSARYILKGTDLTGRPCRIAIENCGADDHSGHIRTQPRIVTDSEALRFLEEIPLSGEIGSQGEDLVIHIHG